MTELMTGGILVLLQVFKMSLLFTCKIYNLCSTYLICDHFPAYLKGLTIHSMSEVKQSIEEPRILLFTTQTPNTGDDELQKYKH